MEPNQSKDILMFSCGVDSLSAWFFMNKPKCIYVDMKTPYSQKERQTIQKLEQMIDGFKVDIIEGINLGQFEVGDKAFIPYRNLILACIGANYGDRIIVAGIQDDKIEDKNPEAFRQMTVCMNALSKPGKMVHVYSPFWEMSKSEIVTWMIENVPNATQILRTSVSCYSKDDGQCGECPSCMRKAVAFEAAGLSVDFYIHDVKKYGMIQEYIDKMKEPDCGYTKKRIDETLGVFKKWGWNV